MTGSSLKSTTAIVIALSLLQPYPVVAQSSSDAQAAQEIPIQTPEEICAEAQILDELTCDLHIAELKATAASESEAQAAVEEQPVEDPEAQADAEAAPETQAEAAKEAEAEADAAAEAQAAQDSAAEAEARTAAEAQAEAEAAAEAQAAQDSAVEAEAAAEAEAEAAAETQADAEAAEAEADVATDTNAAEATADAEATPESNAETSAEPQDAQEPEVEPKTETQSAEEEPAENTLPVTESGSTQALAAETDSEPTADVTTETVTEETSRSSDEEFKENAPDAATASTQTTAAQSNNNNGMSDLQRAGLVALGAAVVGALVLNNKRVESNTGDRVVVVDENDEYQILKDDDALLRQPGSDVRTERFSDGSTRSNVMRADGSEIITIRDATGRVLRRVQVDPNGREYLLFDDTRSFEPVEVRNLPKPANDSFDYQAASDRDALRRALLAADRGDIGRTFSLRQVRETVEVRQLSPEINLQNVTFASASAAIQPSQAENLREMGVMMRDLIAEDPTELFLIEGYTDAVGAPGYNLLLSDRRAESVALAFSEYFDVPAENMVVQGYGESYLKVPTQQAERLNRRVAVRRITALVQNAAR
ncbi:outer membrane protein OmpA-like peptidoglycan-associated protein [Roseovarius sp. MBR-51]